MILLAYATFSELTAQPAYFWGTGISEYLPFHAIALVSLKPALKIVDVQLLRHVVSLYTMLLLLNPVTIKVYCTWLLLLITRQLVFLNMCLLRSMTAVQ